MLRLGDLLQIVSRQRHLRGGLSMARRRTIWSRSPRRSNWLLGSDSVNLYLEIVSRSCTLHRVYRLRPCIWMREATRWIKLACRLSLIHALLSSDLAYPVQALCFPSQSSQALLKASPLTTECTIRLMSPRMGVRACSLPGARHQRTLLGFHPEATVALILSV